MRAYYNENDPFAANWLRNLIAAGLITPGDVDDRSIVDVRPSDLKGYDRCHFFAGIGGWDYALQLAGWTGPVWTGSCPCQPFSSAGKGKGTADERHLWPEFYRLIRECGPATVLIEQVASKAGLEWLDGVFADLEGSGYTCGAADLCAAGINAPHIRQRLFGVAHAGRDELSRHARTVRAAEAERDCQRELDGREYIDAGHGGEVCCGLGQSNLHRCQPGSLATTTNGYGRAADTAGGLLCGLGDTERKRSQGGHVSQDIAAMRIESPGWHDFELIRCVEPTKEPGRYVEKWRRVEPGLVPLASRVSGRVVVSRAGVQTGAEVQEETREVSAAGLLKGYGNSIVPELTAEFITACRECIAAEIDRRKESDEADA